MTLRKQKKKKSRHPGRKSAGGSSTRENGIKKRLAEMKWFIKEQIDSLKVGVEKSLQTQWMLRNLKKITLKMKKKQKMENFLIYKVDGSYDYRN